MTRHTVIITDGEQRSALAAVRSLGAHYRCVVVASSRASLAGSSKFCSRRVVAPDPLKRPEEFAESIVAVSAAEQAAVVLPISEQATLAILPVRSRLSPAVVPSPSLSAFNALSDKQRLLEEAAKLGIDVPMQTVIADVQSAESTDLDAIRFPVVIKPSRSVAAHGGGRARFSVMYASDAKDLRRKIATQPAASFPLLLQQRIEGPGTGVFLLLWNGELRAQFAHRRLYEKPPSGGVSVYRESIALDPDLLERSRELLERFGWYGVAMVEYKQESETGRLFLMEVNGRFWGSLQLAIDAGVDFPRLLVASAIGENVEPQTAYRVGVRSRWWWGQVDHLAGRLRHRASSPALPPGTRSAVRAFGDLVFGPFRREDYEEVLWWDDPRPFWNETLRWMAAR